MKQQYPFIYRTILSSFILSALLVFIATPMLAQTQFTGWLGTFQNYKLSKKTGLYFDAQLRSTGQLQQVHSLLLRPGLNIYFNPAFTGTVGYAYIHQQRTAGGISGYIPEHRTWQQLIYTHRLKLSAHAAQATTLAHRLRVEQRYLPRFHADANSHLVRDGHAYSTRLRYFARAVIPLSGQAKHQEPAVKAALANKPGPFKHGFFASVQNEVFVNIGDASAVNGKFFDQNRAYLSVGYRMHPQFDLELGYMNQYINTAGTNSTNNHILQVATYVRL